MISALQEARLWRMGARRHSVPVGGGVLQAWTVPGQGSLPSLLLLHGMGARSASYVALVQGLLPHVRSVRLFDLPGHGRSAWASPVTARVVREASVEAAVALVDEPTALFGNSLGGYGALWVAAHAPVEVPGVLVTSPAGGALPDALRPAVRDRFRIDSHRDSVELVDRAFHGYRGVERHAVAALARRNLTRPAVRHLVESLGAADELTPEHLARLHMPVQLYWGTSDRALSPVQLAWFRAHLPAHATIHEPDGWSHAAFRERPGEVASALLRFLRSL